LPELPEVESVRRTLEPVMVGVRIERVLVRRADLRAPFPAGFAARLAGRVVQALNRRAKYLLVELSSGETLLMHLGMSGSFSIQDDEGCEPGQHDHVLFFMASGARVCFNDPRRFGRMDLVPTAQLAGHPALKRLGPEPLSAAFDALALARACRGRKTSLKVALLDQRLVAGLGNIYASEALHRAGLSPTRRASTIATVSGRPRPAAERLALAVKRVLAEAIERTTREGSRFRVYEREDRRCRRPGCPGIIKRRTQGGRSTYYCPRCQR
jgi:formamidopyrimidine-DNA glycosylase